MSRIPTAPMLGALAFLAIIMFGEHMAGTDGMFVAYALGFPLGVFVGVMTHPRPE